MEFRVSGVLLDLDGTLVDSTAVVDKHWALVADHLGLERDEVVGRFHGMTADQTMRAIAPSLSEDDHVSLVSDLLAGELGDAGLVTALPGALELVQQLPEDAWAVVTSGPRELAAARLEGAGLPVPARMVTADDVVRGKPDPEPYRRGVEALGLEPGQCLAIEDAPPGVRSAVAAGCQVLGVRTTHPELEVPTVLDLSWVSVAVEGDVLVLSGRQGL